MHFYHVNVGHSIVGCKKACNFPCDAGYTVSCYDDGRDHLLRVGVLLDVVCDRWRLCCLALGSRYRVCGSFWNIDSQNLARLGHIQEFV